jgi:hypothetical protein
MIDEMRREGGMDGRRTAGVDQRASRASSQWSAGAQQHMRDDDRRLSAWLYVRSHAICVFVCMSYTADPCIPVRFSSRVTHAAAAALSGTAVAE